MPMHRIPCVKYRQINHLCIFASGPNLVLNIFLINQGMFSVGGEYRGDGNTNFWRQVIRTQFQQQNILQDEVIEEL